MDLRGRTVLVTGAAKRVGKAIALAFARAGCHILLHHRSSAAEAEAARKEITALGVSCDVLKADLTKASDLDGLFKNPAFGRASVLVNAASVFEKIPFESVSKAHWDENLSIHVVAAFELARAIGLRLKSSGKPGAVVNITETCINRPYTGRDPYIVTKAALANLTKVLALELAPQVRVNSVAPGAVLFPEGVSEEHKAKILAGVPMKRAGSPEDVAQACIFLASADYVNGISLAVDGGRT